MLTKISLVANTGQKSASSLGDGFQDTEGQKAGTRE